jgi:hypothetical protein
MIAVAQVSPFDYGKECERLQREHRIDYDKLPKHVWSVLMNRQLSVFNLKLFDVIRDGNCFFLELLPSIVKMMKAVI